MKYCNGKIEPNPDKITGLGGLTKLYRRLYEMQCNVKNYGVVLFAGDNGISREGISRYEPMNSSDIVRSHLNGKSPTAYFLTRINRPELIVDMGLYTNVDHSALLKYKVCHGSRNFLKADALSPFQVQQALDNGRMLWNEVKSNCFDIIGIGEIGVGDTLCASAIASVLTDNSPDCMTGCGSSDNKVIGQKIDIITKALTIRRPVKNITDLLVRFGGLEIAGLTGFILAAADHGVPVMLDGYVTAVSALLASLENKRVGNYILAPSLSLEKGHKTVLSRLGIEPFFELDFNYGEGLMSSIGLFLAELASSFNNG